MTTSETPGRSPTDALRVPRSATDRLATGVAAGIAHRLGIGPDWVRAGLVTLAFAGGIGIIAYGLAWLLSRPAEGPAEPRTAPAPQRLGLGLMFLGTLFVLRSIGLWFGDNVVWPAGFVAFGIAAIWARRPAGQRDLISRLGDPDERPATTRFLAGVILIVGGTALFMGSIDVLERLGAVALATLITGAGLLLLFGPWIWRLAGDLTRERRERIRSEERAEMAAHLHDSVLQTLSLIQRSSEPKEMVVLARAQERELRSWLYGAGASGADRLGAALEQVASRIEADHKIPIEVVTTGDDPEMTEALRSVVDAAREAMTNAAKHSGAEQISVYAETGEDGVEVWVSDQGSGFDPADLPPGRLGIKESIQARMRRAGGTAEITSTPGEGTEIHLTMVATV
jgi:signal transduction histidine kinase/phage shock protein PspC (stress-responsive transcriptional regulator)